MNNIIDKLKNTKLLAAIGIVCLILGTMLAYVKFSFFGITESISLFKYSAGKLILLLAVINFIFIFNDLLQKYIPKLFDTDFGKKIIEISNSKLSLIPTILAIAFVLYLHSDLDIVSSYTSYGLGFYSLWLGIICLVAYSILHIKKDK